MEDMSLPPDGAGPTPPDLARALEGALAGIPGAVLARATQALSTRYRSPAPAATAIVSDDDLAAA